MNSGGNRSGRVDKIWPSLQNVGPSSSRASRSRLALRARPAVPSSSGRPKTSRSPCLAKTVAIFDPRAIRCGWVSGVGAPARITVPPGAAGIVLVTPSVVFTMITVHRALWLIRFGTLPSRNSLRPAIPALPTTRTSMRASSAAPTIAIAGSSSTTTWARPRPPASRSASAWRASADAAARVRSAAPNSVSEGWVGMITCTRCSSAPNRSAKSFAQPTARDAVWDRSVPTITRWMGPARPGCAFTGASWQRRRDRGREAPARRLSGGGTHQARCAPGAAALRGSGGDDAGARDGRDHADGDGARPEAKTQAVRDRGGEDQSGEPRAGGAFEEGDTAVSRSDAPPGARDAARTEPHKHRDERRTHREWWGRRRRGRCRDLRRRPVGQRACRGVLVRLPEARRIGIAVDGREIPNEHVADPVTGHGGSQEVERSDHGDRRRIALPRKVHDDGAGRVRNGRRDGDHGTRRRVRVRPRRLDPERHRADGD